MATQTGRFPLLRLCLYNKFGYCKHKDHCRKQHVKEVCAKISCDISNCTSRHPKICKFYRDYGMCKFDPCMFRHEDATSQISELKKENHSLLKQIENIDKKLEDLEAKIAKSEDWIYKLHSIEERLEKLSDNEKMIYEKDSQIDALSKKVDAIEASQLIKDEAIKILEERLVHTEALFQKNVNKKVKQSIACLECDFKTNSQQGLKVHMKRKHTLKGTEIYPRKCDLCDVELESKKVMKEHMRHHSYKKANYQCIDCDFLGDNQRTMDVHIGKLHSENVECGLCESILKTIDDLELHLVTCETYTCRRIDCDDFTAKTLEEMKVHIKETHEKAAFVHIKMNRENFNEVTTKRYFFTSDSGEIVDF